MKYLLLICLANLIRTEVKASIGDTSNEYRGCFHICHFNNCTGQSLTKFKQTQDFIEKVFWWNCEDDCKYNCMWHATDVFIDRGRDIPQFFGKWPFVKIFGIQEPASVLFSLFNFHAHLHNILSFRKQVPSTAPMYYVWHLYSLVCLNGWFWSMIFHARDTNFTEKMDYFCAFSMVTFSLVAFFFRVLGPAQSKLKQYLTLGLFMFFVQHIWYLSRRSFDYGYNMKVNILVGLVNGVGWLLWSWTRTDSRGHMVWCRITVALLTVSMLLELLDFAPFLWVFDAHALWHLSTVPLPFYWYRFVVGDCLYLLQNVSDQRKLKKSA